LSTIPLAQVDDAAQWLEEHPEATVIADDPTSPALLWLHEDVVRGRIAFDARLEHFDRDDLLAHFRLITATDPTWLDAAADYDTILISRLYHPRAVKLLDEHPDWRVESEGREGRFYVRVT
jgi:hypothetical protein